MKKLNLLTFTALCASMVMSCKSETPAPSNPIKDALEAAVANGQYMYAMQDATPYGHSWQAAPEDEATRCDVKDVCGDMPAILGFDLGGLELGDAQNLDGVSFDMMRKWIIEHDANGGIITLSWHLRNPLTGGDTWDVSTEGVVASILEGGENHEKFMGWLGKVDAFISSLKDAEGKQIPLIFRPWHENTGGWFWWAPQLCSQEDYKALWKLTYDTLHRDGMLWAYSPSTTLLKEEAFARYPGDEIIDIIGVDHYDSYVDDPKSSAEPHAFFTEALRASLEYINPFAQEHGLLLAVTETGMESIPCPTWWTEALQPALEGLPVCYLLTWRNAWDRPTHFFSPFPGAVCEKDFVDFYNSEKTLFLKDLK